MTDTVSITTAGGEPQPSLLDQIGARAEARSIPLAAHLDLTWKCNEGCVHCYLDHSVGDDMDTAEVKGVLDQLAAAGTMFLTLSGGEIMLRKDIFEIVAYARSLLFDVRLKTNGILISERDADRFAEMGVRQVNISIYSHRPEVHDAITRVPGSFARSIEAIRRLKSRGLTVEMRVPVFKGGADNYARLKALADELGVRILFDATITPRMDGGQAPVALNIDADTREEFYLDPAVTASLEDACAPPTPPGEELLNGHSCGAGFKSCYITPQGDVMPCVTFPLVCGSLRHSSFLAIWKSAPFLQIRGIRNRDLDTCSSCSSLSSCHRCPGLAFMEGNMRGPSIQDCQNTYAQTKVPTPLYPAAPLGSAPLRGPAHSGQFVPLAALLPAAGDRSYRESANY